MKVQAYSNHLRYGMGRLFQHTALWHTLTMAGGSTIWGSGASFPRQRVVSNFAHTSGNARIVLGLVDGHARDVQS